ncbi:MAG: AMP-binding protein [Candidatus Baltobacteraceae bacterium]
MTSAHRDTFTADHLPSKERWPDLIFTRPEFQYAAKLNCASRLLDRHVSDGNGGRRCILAPDVVWTYADLQRKANQIAHVLVSDMCVQPGNRVLLRAPNTPMLAACWFAVMKAGAVAVSTMPLYRQGELRYMIEKAHIRHALCDLRLGDELASAVAETANFQTMYFDNDVNASSANPDSLETRMALQPETFINVDTAAEDVALIGFTSGTTGKAKATMHFHRDIMAICDAFPASVLKASPDYLFCGSPPLAFTFGVGGLLLFPLSIGAATLLLEKASPEPLMQAIAEYKVNVVFTSPIAYRAMTALADKYDISSLRKAVSAGETLPLPIWEAFYKRTGVRIIDGIGSTEMLHIFIASPEERIRPGSTGQVVPGYEARVVDEAGDEVAPGIIGRLAVRGPTGCRYLDDERQTRYVQDGWNLTGDAYRMDEDRYFWYIARADDMIISAGYNISGPEVEEALLAHPDVKECAVVSKPDPVHSTNIVKAFVVLNDIALGEAPGARTGNDTPAAGGSNAHSNTPEVGGGSAAKEERGAELIEFVKSRIASYKAPREIEFVAALPRTETGKVQRFRLRSLSP